MLANTRASYGGVARALHWLTALLILTNIALGLWAEGLPTGSDAEVARAVSAFSIHKTLGVAAFLVALARILWALSQPRPGLLHPSRRLESFAAEVVHWALYGAMLIMPLSGWILHAATDGYSRILWPLGQSLPLVPKSAALGHAAETVHKLSAWVLYIAIALHVAGALKHALIDRDATLARMLRGAAPAVPAQRHSLLAPLAALVVWAGIIASAATAPGGERPALATGAGNGGWQVSQGSLTFAVKQMGADVAGSFTGWTADIDYDPDSRQGRVTVTIPIAGMTLGSVTDQAKGADFFDAEAFPTAVFDAAIHPGEGEELLAEGTLELRGQKVPATLHFTLQIEGETAHMVGITTLDRRDYGMGKAYPDEGTVGFPVSVGVDLTAIRG